ncbi:ferrichrome ABC transporter permease, partial [Clostridioides difficile]
MTKLSKKNITYLLILVSIVVLVFGIVLSITIGAKDMNLSTVIDSLIKMEDGINMRIVKDVKLNLLL